MKLLDEWIPLGCRGEFELGLDTNAQPRDEVVRLHGSLDTYLNKRLESKEGAWDHVNLSHFEGALHPVLPVHRRAVSSYTRCVTTSEVEASATSGRETVAAQDVRNGDGVQEPGSVSAAALDASASCRLWSTGHGGQRSLPW